MEDVHSAGVVDYKSVDENSLKTSSVYIVFLILEGFINFIKVLILSIPIYIKEIINLVLPVKEKSVSGDVALITGGGNGLGREMAIELAKRGCNIAIVDVDMKAAEKTCEDLIAMQVKAKAYKIDVSNIEQIEKLKKLIEIDLGPVDMLINNAGLMPLISLREGTPKDIEKVIDVNYKSHFWTIRTFLPSMIERKKGHIVCISSAAALHPTTNMILYSSTKAAITMLMRALREELRFNLLSDFINLTIVHPYFIATREDIFDVLQLRFPAMGITDAASKIITRTLKNKFIISIPDMIYRFLLIFNLIFPLPVQEMLRDYVIKEYSTLKIKTF